MARLMKVNADDVLEAVSDNGFHVGDNAAVGIYFWIWIKFFNFRISVFFFLCFHFWEKKTLLSPTSLFSRVSKTEEKCVRIREHPRSTLMWRLRLPLRIVNCDRFQWSWKVKLGVQLVKGGQNLLLLEYGQLICLKVPTSPPLHSSLFK